MKPTTRSLRETLRDAPLLNDELVSWGFSYVQNVAICVGVIYAGLLLADEPQSATEAVAGPIVTITGFLLFIWNAAHGVKKVILLPTSRPFAGVLALLVYLAGGLAMAVMLVTVGIQK